MYGIYNQTAGSVANSQKATVVFIPYTAMSVYIESVFKEHPVIMNIFSLSPLTDLLCVAAIGQGHGINKQNI